MRPGTELRQSKRPEDKIRDEIEAYLLVRRWHVMKTHGNMFQSGFPDLFACHSKWGQRWIEVKLPDMKGSKFTAAQLEEFPKLCANGSGVWIMTSATEKEYMKLFEMANWASYLSILTSTRRT